MRGIDADYYGYLDDDDGVLCPLEQAAEKKIRAKLVAEWKERHPGKLVPQSPAKSDQENDKPIPLLGSDEALEIDKLTFISHVPLPTKEDIEQAIVERRKAELLNLYCLGDDEEEMQTQ